MFRFERGPAWPEQPEHVLDGGTDAPIEDRDLRFIVALLLAIFVVAAAITLFAILVGWV